MATYQRNNPIKVFEDVPSKPTTTTSTNNIASKAIAGGKIDIVRRPALRNVSNVQRAPGVGGKKDTTTTTKAKTDTLKPTEVKATAKTKEVVPASPDDIQEQFDELLTDDVKDIDEHDAENMTLCTEYVKDIYAYLRKSEKRMMPLDYMGERTEITEKMRTILIDWLIQVHSKFNLLQETLYLTVYTIDRYLANENVKRTDLQLVGVTAMLLASKYEEMYAPEIGDFVYITDNAYSKEKIKTMEQKMLKTLSYDFSNPLALQFLRRNSKAGDVNAEQHTLAKFLMEMTLISYKFVTRFPSQIAAAALFLSLKISGGHDWSATLRHYSGYSESQLLPVAGDMAALVLAMDGSKYEAVKAKYESSRLLKVSRMSGLRGSVMKSYASYASTAVAAGKS